MEKQSPLKTYKVVHSFAPVHGMAIQGRDLPETIFVSENIANLFRHLGVILEEATDDKE